MTVLFFSAQYLPTVGGVERYTYNLAKRLCAAGNDCVVVTSALAGLPERERDENGIEIFRLPVYPFMGGRFPFIKKNMRFRKLEKELWELEPDFAVINTHFYSSSVYASRQCRKRGIPSILINHGTQYMMTGNPLLSAAGKVYEHLCFSIIKRGCKDYYGVSRACCEWLKTFGTSARGVIYNAVEPGEITAAASRGQKDWRSALNIPPHAPIIAFCGRIIPEKGIIPMCEALDGIRARVPNAVLVFAGAGELLDTVRSRGYSGVYALGQTSHEDSLALISQAQLLCLPTRSEGFSSVVLESAALGTPIVTTPTGGSPELLPDESFGILIPDMKRESIADGCIKALSDKQWCESAAQKTKERLCESFTWDRSAAALTKAIENIQKVKR